MHTFHINKPLVFVTMGDPSGIGPEIIMEAVASPDIAGLAIFIVIGDSAVLKLAAGEDYSRKIVMHDPKTLNIGARHFSISTCGILDGVKKLAKEDLDINLAINCQHQHDRRVGNIGIQDIGGMSNNNS